MTPEVEKQVFESFRDGLRELLNPIIAPTEKMTEWPGGQATAMRDLASACSPSTHRSSLRRLCEKLEHLIDGHVSGVFTKALDQDIEKLHGALEKLRNTCNAYAGFQEPYAGLGGTVRLALEAGTQPWNILMGIAGKHPYQMKRTELEAGQQEAFEAFFDALQSLILAFESAVSNHTGKHFSFRDAYDSAASRSSSSSEN
ncbi:MAG: hypothetical protein MUF31_01440 [Akkermansiaceae bacterium]|jgi:hypothetical protein|nr:hypothetical protein [Akkermansiaceae bacterium]